MADTTSPTPDVRLRRHLQSILFARVLLFSLLLGLLALLPHKDSLLPSWPLLILFVAGVFLLSIASALVLRRSQLNLHRFSRWQVLLDLLCCMLLIVHSGGSRSIFLPLLVFPVSTGALIRQRHGSIKAAAAATLLLGGCLALEYLGQRQGLTGLPFPPPAQPWSLLLNIFAVYGSIFFLVALFGELLAARLARTEHALRESEQDLAWLSRLYKQIFDDIRVGIMTIDDQGRISSYNNAAERITGFVAAEVLDRPLAACFPPLEAGLAAVERRTVDLLKADATPIRVAFAQADLRLPGSCDASTPSAGCRVLTLEDVSQIERIEEQMRQAEKMAVIGGMSAAIAHDMRNPLAAISGAAQLLRLETDAGSGSTQTRLLDIILRESSRLATIITDFLQFSRPAPASMDWFDGRRMVDEAWRSCSAATEPPAACRLDNLVPPEMDFWGDRQQWQTMLRHLLDNCRHACRDREGRVEVRAWEECENDGSASLFLEVRDNGPGIPPEELEKIFAPFFSTREDGTGLGLAIVLHLAAQHHGVISAANAPAGGAVFRLRLPLPLEDNEGATKD